MIGQISAPVLIVGAGPTGLVLALRLQRHGIPFRLIDQHSGPGQQSRALVVQARTLEFYRQLGIAEELIEHGTLVRSIRLRKAGRDVVRFSLQDIGAGLSPYATALDLPQDEHEELLIAKLAALGVSVERNTKLERLEQNSRGVSVALSHGGATEEASFDYVAGCDGAHSRVRQSLAVEFAGGTYTRLFYVADVKLSDPGASEIVVSLDRDKFGLRMPSRRGENERLVGFVPEPTEAQAGFEAVRGDAEQLMGIKIKECNWFSTYKVEHRVAQHFKVGRCFLLGDAGHVHSPVGGQGMNTGIGDAVNLSWKLAHVILGRAPATLLETYEPERIAFARSLVASTDQAFRVVSDSGLAGYAFRNWLMPRLLPLAARFQFGRRAIFRLVSQIRVAYPTSPLSEGQAGQIAGGDRLPWVTEADNFAPLAACDWQLHCFGNAEPELMELARTLALPVHSFNWSDQVAKVGFGRDVAYLIRPDGYVGLCGASSQSLTRYTARHGLQFGGASGRQHPAG